MGVSCKKNKKQQTQAKNRKRGVKDPERTESTRTEYDIKEEARQRRNTLHGMHRECVCVCEEKEGRMRDEASQPACVVRHGGWCCSSSGGSLAVTQH